MQESNGQQAAITVRDHRVHWSITSIHAFHSEVGLALILGVNTQLLQQE